MKKTQLKEIKNLEIKALRIKIKEAKNTLTGIVMEKSEGTKGSKDVKAFFKKRKDIAQMLTILRQKEMIDEIELKHGTHLRGVIKSEAGRHLGGGLKEAKI